MKPIDLKDRKTRGLIGLGLIGAGILGLILLGGGAAKADEAAGPNWTGCHVGIQGGYSMADVDVSAGPLNIDGLGAQGFVGGVHGGCDYKIANTIIVIGAFGDYNWQNVEFNAGVGPFKASASLGNSWTVGGRAGVTFGNALPYVLVGYTQADTSVTFLGNSLASSDLNGWTYGGGVEFMLTPSVSMAAEYRFTRFGSENVFGGAPILASQTDQQTAMLRLNIHLNAVAGK